MIKLHRAVLLPLFFIAGMAASAQAPAKPLVVSAAASLKDAFIDAARAFEKDNPASRVSFNFANSSQLASQVEQGAPVDVFASADMVHIERLAGKNLLAEHAVMAHNKLVMIVSTKSAAKVRTLGDLSNRGLRLVMAGKQIPVSAYTRQFLQKAQHSGAFGADFSARVLANTVSEEPDVRMVAMKVALGEGDAGIVYVSDVAGDIKNKVKLIAIADGLNVSAEYGIAVIKGSAKADAGRAFVRFLLSPTGQSILMAHGLAPARQQ